MTYDLLVRSAPRSGAGAHCINRRDEWAHAFMVLGCGATVCFSPSALTTGGFYLLLNLGLSQAAMGPFFMMVGMLRLAALFHNGRWPFWGPIIRSIGCIVGTVLWVQLFVALAGYGAKVGTLPLGVSVYLVLIVSEVFALRRAAHDVERP